MPEYLYLLSIGLPLATILLVFAMRYFAQVRQAQARIIAETAYRATAEKSAAAQAESAAALSAIQAELSAVNARLAAVERILKAVE